MAVTESSEQAWQRSTLAVPLRSEVIDRCAEDPDDRENGKEGRLDHDHSFDVPHRGYGNLRLSR
jgi:hypothetical protein